MYIVFLPARAIPTNVMVTNIMTTQFTVSWGAIQGASSCDVEANPLNNSLMPVNILSVNGITINVFNLEPSQAYSVTVRGNYVTGRGDQSIAVQRFTGKIFKHIHQL